MSTARRQPWHIQRDASLVTYAFFISHVNEDAEPANQFRVEIERKQPDLRCFLDVHNWPLGNDNSWAIKRSLLISEYMLVWVTPAYLKDRRGWVWQELAYAELLELSQNSSRLELELPFIVPIFQGVKVTQVARTPLFGYWQRNLLEHGPNLFAERDCRKSGCVLRAAVPPSISLSTGFSC